MDLEAEEHQGQGELAGTQGKTWEQKNAKVYKIEQRDLRRSRRKILP